MRGSQNNEINWMIIELINLMYYNVRLYKKHIFNCLKIELYKNKT